MNYARCSATPDTTGSQSVGLLLSRDLIFTSKITGTARELGHLVMVADSVPLALEMILKWQPRVIFIDLTGGDLVATDALLSYRRLVAPSTAFIAFGSHLDTATLAAARLAGCDPVMPRSRFSAQLPELIRAYFERNH